MPEPDDDRSDPLGKLLRAHAASHRAPPRLAARIDARLALEVQRAPGAGAKPHEPRWWAWPAAVRVGTWRLRWAPAAAFGAGALLSWLVTIVVLSAPPAGGLADAVAARHAQALLADRPVAVASSDHHVVKPWFAGRLDFSPPVVDLSAHGAPLVGARIEAVDGRTMAVLVYRVGPHWVDVFVAPDGAARAAAAGAAGSATAWSTARGWHVARWSQGAMQAFAVSDLNATELRDFVDRLRRAVAAH